MNAQIITIGDELLIGQTVDTNSAWIAKRLNLIGIKIDRIVTVKDEAEDITSALDDVDEGVNVVVITGGLGPTKDDITKKTLTDYTGDELVFNQKVYEHIESYFLARGRTVGENNRAQAMVPSKCRVLDNFNGTAPGMWFDYNNRIMVSIPGVPYEMKAIMENEVLPRLRTLPGRKNIIHRHVITQGIPESVLMEKIKEWEETLKDPLKLAYLPSAGTVKLRLTAFVEGNLPTVEKAIEAKVTELEKVIPEYIVGHDSETMEENLGRKLRELNLKMATAESCTGGYIAHLITSVAGSSDYFQGSVVSYSNEMKMNMLNVSEKDLKEHGAVSKEVVEAMLKGVLEKTGADVGVATSGVAGPGGGTKGKPVGTIWIAVGSKDNITSERFLFGNERMMNITRTARTAMNMLRKELVLNY